MSEKLNYPEINFYQVSEDLHKVVIALLLKILEEKKTALIFIKDLKRIQEFDAQIWSYGRSKFIPHSTIFDKELPIKRQPILLSNTEENANSADYLIFLDQPSKEFLNKFLRVFYFFENEPILEKDISPTNFFKREAGKWVKIQTNS